MAMAICRNSAIGRIDTLLVDGRKNHVRHGLAIMAHQEQSFLAIESMFGLRHSLLMLVHVVAQDHHVELAAFPEHAWIRGRKFSSADSVTPT